MVLEVNGPIKQRLVKRVFVSFRRRAARYVQRRLESRRVKLKCQPTVRMPLRHRRAVRTLVLHSRGTFLYLRKYRYAVKISSRNGNGGERYGRPVKRSLNCETKQAAFA